MVLKFFNKNGEEEHSIIAPMTGGAVSVTAIPDEVFSEKLLGDGVAIIPDEGEVVSPVNGKIIQVADTYHAFGIRSDDGLDILVHIGVDTVGLKGKGFKVFVENGQEVQIGDRIAKVDVKFIEASGFPTHTALLITNINEIKNIKCFIGLVEAGKTKIITYDKK